MDMATNAVDAAVIRGAGGLVWRESPRGRELAIVRRTRHGEEIALPKGKLRPGESWTQAAHREVREETGCEARIDTFAGCNTYPTQGGSKMVLFWNMTLISIGECSDQDEVKGVLWLTPSEAVACLTHDGERGILIGSGALDDDAQSLALARRVDLASRWKRFWLPASAQRLAEALVCYSIELEYLKAMARNKGVQDESWATAASALLHDARTALQEGDADRGWHCFLAAQRMELWGLHAVNPMALQLRAETIRRESLKKLSGWRKTRIASLLGPAGEEDEPGSSAPKAPPPSIEAICEAALILHHHFDNEGVKRRAGAKQMLLLVTIALATVGTWLVLLVGYPEWRAQLLPAAPHIGSPGLTATVILFGLMGASLSGIISSSSNPAGVKIPDLLFSFRVTLARLAVGILSALAANVILTSGFLKIGNLPVSTPVILLAALAAGFSERLVAGTLTKVAGDKA